MSKRAGKNNLRKEFKGHTDGPGGVTCECCGASHNAKKSIRREAKQDLYDATREANSESIQDEQAMWNDYFARLQASEMYARACEYGIKDFLEA